MSLTDGFFFRIETEGVHWSLPIATLITFSVVLSAERVTHRHNG